MSRAFRFILIFLVGFWFTQNPGHIHVEWLGYQVDTSMAFILLSVVTLIFLMGFVKWGWHGIMCVIRSSLGVHTLSSKANGETSLAQAMCALEFGNYEECKKASLRAMGALPDSPLPALTLLKVAKQLKDKRSQHLALTHLKKFHHYTPIAVYDEIEAALLNQENSKASMLLSAAREKFDDQGWFLKQGVKVAIGAQEWEEALEKLKRAVKKGAFTKEESRKLEAMLFYKLSQQKGNDLEEKLRYLEKAYDRAPAFPPLLLPYAETLLRHKDKRAAKEVLEKAWIHNPLWELADYYCRTFSESPKPLDRVHVMRDLYDLCPEHPVSRLCLIIYCLHAKLWAEAERHIKGLPSDAPEALILKAALVRAQKASEVKVSQYLRAAMEKLSIPFKCDSCKVSLSGWDFYCKNCGAFDSIYLKHPITFENCLKGLD